MALALEIRSHLCSCLIAAPTPEYPSLLLPNTSPATMSVADTLRAIAARLELVADEVHRAQARSLALADEVHRHHEAACERAKALADEEFDRCVEAELELCVHCVRSLRAYGESPQQWLCSVCYVAREGSGGKRIPEKEDEEKGGSKRRRKRRRTTKKKRRRTKKKRRRAT